MAEEKIFSTEYTVFQKKINKIMSEKPCKELIESLIELQLYKNAEKDDKKLVFVELYNLLGTEKFYEVLNLLAGKTIKFPEKNDFKETIQIALSYFYKEYYDYEWDKIKDLIGDEEMSTVKFGIKIQQLSRFMDYIGAKLNSKIEREENERPNS